MKKDAVRLHQEVWNRRTAFSDLKRKFPTLIRKKMKSSLSIKSVFRKNRRPNRKFLSGPSPLIGQI